MLRELQRDFRAALLTGASPPEGTNSRRFEIYRNNVRAGLTDVLATAFPVVRRIVGAADFDKLAAAFIAAHPPRAPQLSGYGSELPEFICQLPALADRPFLTDVARLEWARAEAYFAADAPVLDPAALAPLLDHLDRARLGLHPATRLVRSPYPIWTIWQAEGLEVPPKEVSLPESVLISRPRHHVVTREVSEADAALVAALAAGATLGQAVESAGAFALQEALYRHFENGTFSSVSL
jgi:hypothetical protein